jgi:hypothetical protein
MKRFLAFLRSLFGRKPAPITRPLVGVCVHRVNDDDVAALRSMGVKHVRMSIYGNNAGETWIDAALAAGLDVLCVAYRTPEQRIADKLRWPTVTWQYENEPQWRTVTPQEAAASTWGGDVTCGIGHGTPTAWINLFRSLVTPMRLAFHIYGVPLSAAVPETLAQFPRDAGAWITEIGDKDSANEVAKTLRLIDGAKYPRVYVYALWSPDDGYTLTPAHRQVIRDFIQGVV